MGREIVYCSTCQTQLRSSDFEKSGAIRIDGQAYCKACAPAPKEAPRDRTPRRGTSKHATRSIPIVQTPGTRRFVASKSGSPLVWIGVAGAALLVVVLAVAAGSGGSAPRPVERERAEAPPPPPPPPLPAPDPSLRREEAAKASLLRAREFAAANPGDLAGQRTRVEQAAADARDTSVLDAVRAELRGLEERMFARREADLAQLEAKAKPLAAAEDFGAAVRVYEEARERHPETEWRTAVGGRIRELHDAAARLYAPLREKALDARKRKADAEVAAAKARVARWGRADLKQDLEQALAAVVDAPPPPPPPPPPDPNRKARMAALELAAGRDYAAAIRELERLAGDPEAAELARTLKALAAAVDEAWKALAKSPRASLRYVDPSGAPALAEGTVSVDARRIEVRKDDAAVSFPPGELTAASLAERIPDRALAELLGRLEKEAEPPSADREAEARRAFYAAEFPLASPATAASAAEALAALPAETRFVRRNRAAILARIEGAKDFFFLADALRGAGTFQLAKHPKAGACWTGSTDATPASRKDNFVELEFSVLAGAEYRCWVYVGGCCQETLAVWYQGTGLAGLEPGGVGHAGVRHSLSATRSHTGHVGPKEPVRWGWVALPLPKYESGGVQQLRLLTDQRGFSVAHAVVSAVRAQPPAEAEVREREKSNAAKPAAIDPSLVGHWAFSEGAGATARDSSRHANSLTLQGGAAWAADRSVAFDGQDDHLRAPDSPSLSSCAKQITVAAWVWRGSGQGGNVCIATRQQGGGYEDQFALFLSNGVPKFNLLTTAGTREPEGPSLPLQQWVHLAGSFDGASARLYVNGAEAAAQAVPAGTALVVEPKPLLVGAGINNTNDAPGEFFHGRIGDLRIYSRALGPAEIAALAKR
jgi:hypothetical protein